MLTTFTSYGQVPVHRQGDLIRAADRKRNSDPLDDPDVRALLNKIKNRA